MVRASGISGTYSQPIIQQRPAWYSPTAATGKCEVARTFRAFAEGVLARGWSAALPGYTLAPAATLTQIVSEVRSALDWLAAQGNAHGITGPVIISGWSAGGHLTALLLDHPSVRGGLAISGIYELGPIRDTYLNKRLKLTDEEVSILSPTSVAGGQ